uniref:Uncharacterized protein n=1 Tax=Anopheles atroparvus TaxID=41427 RepID=A0A182JKG5_ANOAO
MVRRWDTSVFSAELFAEALRLHCFSEVAVDPATLISTLRRACDETMPRLSGGRNRTNVYWWTEEIAELRTACQRAQATLRRTRDRTLRSLRAGTFRARKKSPEAWQRVAEAAAKVTQQLQRAWLVARASEAEEEVDIGRRRATARGAAAAARAERRRNSRFGRHPTLRRRIREMEGEEQVRFRRRAHQLMDNIRHLEERQHRVPREVWLAEMAHNRARLDAHDAEPDAAEAAQAILEDALRRLQAARRQQRNIRQRAYRQRASAGSQAQRG